MGEVVYSVTTFLLDEPTKSSPAIADAPNYGKQLSRLMDHFQIVNPKNPR